MAVLRISDAAFNVYTGQYIMTVDVLATADGEDFTELIAVPKDKVYTQEDLQRYIEQEILNRQRIDPDYRGLTWKSTQF